MAAAKIEDGKRGRRGGLVVASEPSAAGDPTERAPDHPAPGLDGKALVVLVRSDDLDRDGGGRTDPLSLASLIGKAVDQGRPEVTECQKRGAYASR
ncbi:hypothetical protein FHR71_004885 [Methylobacterium sp. RAS18]|nr:hypothetical protein [Methylobacterium sp. RAS18]